MMLRVLLAVAVTSILFKATDSNNDPCLVGFTEALPPLEEWDNYQVLSADKRNLIYPNLKFACEGTLHQITIPLKLPGNLNWRNVVGLRVELWRQQNTGEYAMYDRIAFLTSERETSVTYTWSNTKGKAIAKFKAYPIKKNDIVGFHIQNDRFDSSASYNVRITMPILLRPIEFPNYSGSLPMLTVNFTAASRETQQQGNSNRTEFEGRHIGCNQRQKTSEKEPLLGCDYGLPVTIAIVVTQIEATLLSSITVILIIYCCHLRKGRRKSSSGTNEGAGKKEEKSNALGTSNNNIMEKEKTYMLPHTSKMLSPEGKEYSEVKLQPSPAYGLQSIRDRDSTPDYRKYI